jgi:anti-anti-sigma factor
VLSGRIDRDGDEAMTGAWQQARVMGSGDVVLDFARTDYINSTGIALIVRLLAEARRDARPVRASGLSEHYREIFRITRLSDFVTIDDSPTNESPGTTAEPADRGAPQPATEPAGGTR